MREPSTFERVALGLGLVALVLVLAASIEGCRSEALRRRCAEACAERESPTEEAMVVGDDGRHFVSCGCEGSR